MATTELKKLSSTLALLQVKQEMIKDNYSKTDYKVTPYYYHNKTLTVSELRESIQILQELLK